ncbi:hypothetical protein [Cupriavidus gilardii]|uniref:Uncharacterized protein n=1 Tax=Cupriavidus gilardii TaxID=82541 RepID=A0A849BP83_9BURK|nr:hypothetical protein [Cupriavidus gilardii]KAB0592793.1 hypothetical protein F7Q96_26015 [Cupriavidus gilardii]NNH14287.1 hypothetical protein [Cupriavidus gilardii]
MSTYTERLTRAMKVRGLDPAKSQSLLAKLVGQGCKPQNIQHLLDPNKNAKSSKYTARIATVLKVDPEWLAYEIGEPPTEGSLFGQEVPPGELEKAQKEEARRLLDGLSGSKLTRALALLQDLSVSEHAEGRIVGGEPDDALPFANVNHG